jgi:hypothetical protein
LGLSLSRNTLQPLFLFQAVSRAVIHTRSDYCRSHSHSHQPPFAPRPSLPQQVPAMTPSHFRSLLLSLPRSVQTHTHAQANTSNNAVHRQSSQPAHLCPARVTPRLTRLSAIPHPRKLDPASTLTRPCAIRHRPRTSARSSSPSSSPRSASSSSAAACVSLLGLPFLRVFLCDADVACNVCRLPTFGVRPLGSRPRLDPGDPAC